MRVDTPDGPHGCEQVPNAPDTQRVGHIWVLHTDEVAGFGVSEQTDGSTTDGGVVSVR